MPIIEAFLFNISLAIFAYLIVNIEAIIASTLS